jgi:hypothetical protein
LSPEHQASEALASARKSAIAVDGAHSVKARRLMLREACDSALRVLPRLSFYLPYSLSVALVRYRAAPYSHKRQLALFAALVAIPTAESPDGYRLEPLEEVDGKTRCSCPSTARRACRAPACAVLSWPCERECGSGRTRRPSCAAHARAFSIRHGIAFGDEAKASA